MTNQPELGIKHYKPGHRLDYAGSVAYVEHMGGQLLTLEEAQTFMNGKALYPNEGQWCAI